MKGLFIPDITAEMFRNCCLESIEELMAEGEIYDIEYDTKFEETDVPDINVGDMISRQDAITVCNSAIDLWEGQLGVGALVAVRDKIAELTINPERKKGKWLPDNNNYYEERFICSVCGKSYKVDTCMGKPMWDFCPCSADMREVAE